VKLTYLLYERRRRSFAENSGRPLAVPGTWLARAKDHLNLGTLSRTRNFGIFKCQDFEYPILRLGIGFKFPPIVHVCRGHIYRFDEAHRICTIVHKDTSRSEVAPAGDEKADCFTVRNPVPIIQARIKRQVITTSKSKPRHKTCYRSGY
jgi:hypothetical protein